jgi:hypothetical protein
VNLLTSAATVEIAIFKRALSLAFGLFWIFMARAADTAPPAMPSALITVRSNGVVVYGEANRSGLASAKPRILWQHEFGLPSGPPEQQSYEKDSIPICNSRWCKDGIRYTQIVLVTRLGDGDPWSDGETLAGLVLLVQLVGENTASEYTEARAGLSLKRDQQELNLELREGQVHEAGKSSSPLLALVDIPAGGVGVADGTRLQFQGNMPPGTSGAMTIKIPLADLNGEAELNRLRFLDFTEEMLRVRKYWQTKLKTSPPASLPVAFASQKP